MVTAVGQDRPGIVDHLSKTLLAHDGMINKTRMVRLGKEFAALILVSVPEEQVDRLSEPLGKVAGGSLTVTLHPTEYEGQKLDDSYILLETFGMEADQEEIISSISELLYQLEINIDELETEVIFAPFSGTAFFNLQARLATPLSITQKELEEKLRNLGKARDVTIRIIAPGDIEHRLSGTLSI